MFEYSKRAIMVCLTVFLALTLAVIACGGTSPEPPPPPPPDNPSPEAPPEEPPGPPAAENLSLGEVRIEPNNDSYNTYKIVATIYNHGDGDASGFNAGCTYLG